MKIYLKNNKGSGRSKFIYETFRYEFKLVTFAETFSFVIG